MTVRTVFYNMTVRTDSLKCFYRQSEKIGKRLLTACTSEIKAHVTNRPHDSRLRNKTCIPWRFLFGFRVLFLYQHVTIQEQNWKSWFEVNQHGHMLVQKHNSKSKISRLHHISREENLSFIAPTLICKFWLSLSLYRFTINLLFRGFWQS